MGAPTSSPSRGRGRAKVPGEWDGAGVAASASQWLSRFRGASPGGRATSPASFRLAFVRATSRSSNSAGEKRAHALVLRHAGCAEEKRAEIEESAECGTARSCLAWTVDVLLFCSVAFVVLFWVSDTGFSDRTGFCGGVCVVIEAVSVYLWVVF